MNTKELENYMQNFYGSLQLFKSPMFLFKYTEGVKGFAEKAEAYWFLVEANIAIHDNYQKRKDDFLIIKLIVELGEADIVLIGDDDKKRVVKHIIYTDCPDGEWTFFYDKYENVLLWHGEY